MTDKERIEVYVNELPKSCYYCPLCYELEFCRIDNDEPDNIWDISKYECRDDRRMPNCPLKTIQSVQNQKAVAALWELETRVKALRDLEISAIRESREFDFKTEAARLEWIKTKTECSKIYNNEIKIIDQLISELGGKE